MGEPCCRRCAAYDERMRVRAELRADLIAALAAEHAADLDDEWAALDAAGGGS